MGFRVQGWGFCGLGFGVLGSGLGFGILGCFGFRAMELSVLAV